MNKLEHFDQRISGARGCLNSARLRGDEAHAAYWVEKLDQLLDEHAEITRA